MGCHEAGRGPPRMETESSWLHWDQNPWAEPGFVRHQAILCLTDNTATSGGFACVPGFHKEFRRWGEDHPLGSVMSPSGRILDEGYGVNQPFPLPLDDPCQERIVRVLAPQGSMVVWDSRLPHQNFPNSDKTNFRVVFYCMMKVKDPQAMQERRELLRKKAIVVTTLDGEQKGRFPAGLSPVARDIFGVGENDLSGGLSSIPDGLAKAIPLVLEAG